MLRSVLVIALLLTVPLATAVAETNPFLAAGIPAATRSWTGPDYERTAEVLIAGKVPLPKLSDPQGAALLRRVTSTDNLAAERDRKIPLSLRLQDLRQIQLGATALLQLYLDAADKGGGYRPELAAVTGFLLHSSAQQVDLVEELMPTLVKDEAYATRMAGLKEMNEGLTTGFVGTEVMLSERNNFSADDLSLLLEAMAQTLPRMKTGFSPEVRIELRKKLEADKARFKKDEDARRLDQMIAELGKP
jgi:hypothetical protein